MQIPLKRMFGTYENLPLKLVLNRDFLHTRQKFEFPFVTYAIHEHYDLLDRIEDFADLAYIVIPAASTIEFYLKNYHKKFKFVVDAALIKKREYWSEIYDSSGLFQNNENIISRTLKTWIYLKGFTACHNLKVQSYRTQILELPKE